MEVAMDYALIGEKLSHSYSPNIHNSFFKKNNIDSNYGLIELKKEELSDFCEKVKKGSIKGFNITIPYKEDIFSMVDEIDPKAKTIGAINTVKNCNGKLYAYNTDYYGYLYSVQKLSVPVKNEKVIVLGNGGSAKAVIEVLKDLGAKEIFLVSRNPSKTSPEGITSVSYDKLESIGKASFITNCTPVGMYPNMDSCPIEKSLFKNYSYAIDLIYNPKETLFLQYAKEFGASTLNGLFMLLGQAIKAEELWQNMEISMETINELYKELQTALYGG